MQSPVSYSVPTGSVAVTSAPSGSAPTAYPGVNPARSFVSSLAKYQQAQAQRRQAVEAARKNMAGMLRGVGDGYQLPVPPKSLTDTPMYGRPVSRGDGMSKPAHNRGVPGQKVPSRRTPGAFPVTGGWTAGSLYGIGM